MLTRGRDPHRHVSPVLGEGSSVWKADLDRDDLELGWYQKRGSQATELRKGIIMLT